jgi:hypothetical protein
VQYWEWGDLYVERFVGYKGEEEIRKPLRMVKRPWRATTRVEIEGMISVCVVEWWEGWRSMSGRRKERG